MKNILQNTGTACILILFLPYIITLFLNGRQGVHTEEKLPDREYQVLRCLMQEDLSWMSDKTLELMSVLYRTEYVRTGIMGLEEPLSVEMDDETYIRMYNAVINTQGKVILIDGEYRELPYHMVSAGRTRDGRSLGKAFSYVTAEECPLDLQSEYYFSLGYFREEELQTALGDDFDPAQMKVERDESGYVIAVVCKASRWTGEEFRKLLRLSSSCFWMEETERGTRMTVKGSGHGFGISLYTADQMFQKGSSLQNVLDRFYQDAECITIP